MCVQVVVTCLAFRSPELSLEVLAGLCCSLVPVLVLLSWIKGSREASV